MPRLAQQILAAAACLTFAVGCLWVIWFFGSLIIAV